MNWGSGLTLRPFHVAKGVCQLTAKFLYTLVIIDKEADDIAPACKFNCNKYINRQISAWCVPKILCQGMTDIPPERTLIPK